MKTTLQELFQTLTNRILGKVQRPLRSNECVYDVVHLLFDVVGCKRCIGERLLELIIVQCINVHEILLWQRSDRHGTMQMSDVLATGSLAPTGAVGASLNYICIAPPAFASATDICGTAARPSGTLTSSFTTHQLRHAHRGRKYRAAGHAAATAVAGAFFCEQELLLLLLLLNRWLKESCGVATVV